MSNPNREFMSGDRLYLRPLEESDLERCVQWVNSPEIRRTTLNASPMNMVAERAWFERMSTAQTPFTNVIFAIALRDGDVHIGNTGLHHIDWIFRRATSGSMIGDPAMRGQGYGSEAKHLLLSYAFDTLNLEKVESSVVDFNIPSARHLEKNGYVREGVRRRSFFKEGKWCDEYLYGVLADEWRTRTST